MAVSNEPATMWSAARCELLHHIWAWLVPFVGGTKYPSSPDGTSGPPTSYDTEQSVENAVGPKLTRNYGVVVQTHAPQDVQPM